MISKEIAFSNVVLLDQSPRMLEHSRKWELRGASLLIADAANTQLPSESFQLIVSSLGDPYNDESFWREASRLLSSGGACLFTAPTPEWSERFRARSNRKAAEFVLANGKKIFVRSDILSVASQSELIEAVGLYLDEIQSFYASQLTGPVSKKLLVDGPASSMPIVRGFTVKKR
jgi:hypothetical protein